MAWRTRLKCRVQDWAMRQMDELRPEVLAPARGEVLELGFGTGLNLAHYPKAVTSLVGVDPLRSEGFAPVAERVARAAFPVDRQAPSEDGTLPFDAGRFDTVVTTWTVCSIPDAALALAEMRRVLRPGGRYLFVEHGLASEPRVARWQERLDPYWSRFADGCHMNRPVDRLVEQAGFGLASLERFRHKGPGVLAHMFRGVATREA
ncbi:MAG TPA: class I SAM-dependent methyltransferase [Myxococcota bacterium]|nr:class I SAM-dependent methyltransferase [Myxococcota bacterium]